MGLVHVFASQYWGMKNDKPRAYGFPGLARSKVKKACARGWQHVPSGMVTPDGERIQCGCPDHTPHSYGLSEQTS